MPPPRGCLKEPKRYIGTVLSPSKETASLLPSRWLNSGDVSGTGTKNRFEKNRYQGTYLPHSHTNLSFPSVLSLLYSIYKPSIDLDPFNSPRSKHAMRKHRIAQRSTVSITIPLPAQLINSISKGRKRKPATSINLAPA